MCDSSKDEFQYFRREQLGLPRPKKNERYNYLKLIKLLKHLICII